ncbi:MAG TPA: 2-dehydropantoate 2-reductase [Baekduia sp.]|nr:2-dehydropantoate 2-reductase [Baekduia sp.]
MTRIAVLGPGAVGGLLAAALARAQQEVVLVGRPGSVEAVSGAGLEVQSPRFGTFRTRVRAHEALDVTGDVLVVAVKAPALAAALDRVTGTPAAVVPLLNGVEHVAVLGERFGERVVPGVIRVQAHRDGPARVVHRAPFVEVTLAEPGCPALEAALAAAGVDVGRDGDGVDVLWGKLTRLAALALATAAADAPLGEVRDDARAVCAEVATVARAEGAGLDAAGIADELDGLPDAASSSLRADVAAGAPHELDAIAGAVQRAAARHGLATPCTDRLAAAVAARALA